MSWADQNLPEADVVARIDAALAEGDQGLIVQRRVNQLLRRVNQLLRRVVSPAGVGGWDWSRVADGVIDYE